MTKNICSRCGKIFSENIKRIGNVKYIHSCCESCRIKNPILEFSVKILLVVFFTLFIFSDLVYASWLSGWNYRAPITINNTANSNTLTDYQVLVTLDTASLISAGKMRSDCGDIRFTDSDGTTLLNYWIESGCNTNNTIIWVKVPSIPASSTKTIYVYYGNSNATSLSNITMTFIFGDDMNSDRRNEYTRRDQGGTAPTLNWDSLNGYYYVMGTNDGGYQHDWVPTTLLNTNTNYDNTRVVVFVKVANNDNSNGGGAGYWVNNGNGNFINYHISWNPSGFVLTKFISGASTVLIREGTPDTNWHRLEIRKMGNNYSVERDFGAFRGSTTISDTSLVNYNNIPKLSFRAFTTTVYWDYFFVAKYTSPEPTISLGAEETGQKLFITIYSPTNTTYYTNQILANFTVYTLNNVNITVKAFLDGNLIYENNSYANNTITTFYLINLNVGKQYNFTVWSNDSINTAAQTVLFYVFFGLNISTYDANTTILNSFNLESKNATHTIIINNLNSPALIEWKNLTYGNSIVTIFKNSYDNETKSFLINESMGLINVNYTLYKMQYFYLRDNGTNTFLSNFKLYFNNYSNSKATNTNFVNISLRELNLNSNNLLCTERWGYVNVCNIFNFTLNSNVNYTFNTFKSLIKVYRPLTEIGEGTIQKYVITFQNTTFQKVYGIDLSSESCLDDNNYNTACVSCGGAGVCDFSNLAFYASTEISKQVNLNVSGRITCGTTGTCYWNIYLYMYNFQTKSWDIADGINIYNNGPFSDRTFSYVLKFNNNDVNKYGFITLLKINITTASYSTISINEVNFDNNLNNWKVFNDRAEFTVLDSNLPTNLVFINFKDNAENYYERSLIATNTQYSYYIINPFLCDRTNCILTRVKVVDAVTHKEIENAIVTSLLYSNTLNYKTTREQHVTDSLGYTLFSFYPSFIYTLKVTHPNKVCKDVDIQPATSEVWLLCGGGETKNYTTFMFDDISLYIRPDDITIQNNTNIVYSIVSNRGLLNSFCMEVKTNITLYSNCASNPSGGELSYFVNVSKFDAGTKLFVSYNFTFNNSFIYKNTKVYYIKVNAKLFDVVKIFKSYLGEWTTIIILFVALISGAYISKFSIMGAGIFASFIMLFSSYIGLVDWWISILFTLIAISINLLYKQV